MNKKQFTLKLSAVAVSILLASCGGGGSKGYFNVDSPSTPTDDTAKQVPAELLSIGQNKSSLNAGGEDSLTLTIRTLNKSGGIIPKANVTIEIKDADKAGANLSTASKLVSDENGLIKTDISLINSTLNQRMNRSIVVIVSSGNVKQELTIPVNGTAVTIASDVNLLEEGESASVTLTALDAIGKPLIGAKASLLDASGNTVGDIKATDNDGKAVFKVPYSSVVGMANRQLILTGKLTVEDGNQPVSNLLTTESATLTANVANNILQLTSDPKPVGVGESKLISVKIIGDTKADLDGKEVVFATTNGTVTPKATITNIRQENGKWVGDASTTLVGTIASIATISAKFGTNVIYIAQKISAGVPATISIQSESTVLAPGANTKVVALVKDKNGTPIPDTEVSFSVLKDTSVSGRISQPTAMTDSAGRATVIYTAGSAQTLGGGVEIQASAGNAIAPKPVYSPNLLLTVSTQSAYITVAQNHEVIKDPADETYYYKAFSASVVDTAGNPIANQKISISLDLASFMKGRFNWVRDYSYAQTSEGMWSWLGFWRWSRDYTIYENNVPKRITTFVECPSNEFPNPVVILDTKNESLGTKSTFTTDAQGKFDFKVRYANNYSNWLRVNLTASTIVSTKDNMTALSFVPPVAAVDVDDTDGKWRPDDVSPYGEDITTCNNYK
ncbi:MULTISPECIES: Ig-like domain-containing protein [unclassified Acinetobacter]|uniref:Ig-like domain-containing protein n=1 Tax=unclassified Acinetobacter TaxID=196816 RepID=UPI0024482364|nr:MULTISPECIES: Ig-like domain-containing protein [unclassified Acinetobacter]MDH0032639.1 Ig-like domain-containing protein [Acinetobacter sp. GD04021]MDH0886947.1 Ig-like domain-containing protein [Acinetobacter sp. GD03873]MDH1083240.1 Ig-like domain-containing protein [Acinetobacter sp. GD03983]MDH2190263.1 Ig-like domain-containing protein [Acinetobacter sp. GD03645]MDH2203258.1 Ig-like domain-containing protein [Acinetobacter sp. GD03647]